MNKQNHDVAGHWKLMQQHCSNVYKHDTLGHPQGSRTTRLTYRFVCSVEGLNEIKNPKYRNKVLNVIQFFLNVLNS